MSSVERRIGLLFVVFALMFVAAVARAAWLGSIKSQSLSKAAVSQQVSDVTVPAPRGTITDRHGVELAVSQTASDVAATPYLIKDQLRVAERIAPILGQDKRDLLPKLSLRNTGFVYLARKLPAARAAQLERLEIEGLEIIPTSKRTYPRNWLASQLLGTVGVDNDGLSGLEYGRDKALRGRDGERRLVNDALGQPISLREVKTARAGQDLQLTIDASIQDEVENALSELGNKYRPKGATAVVMDPRSGEVLALANWPRVNANDVGGAPPYAKQNRALAASYEPGSTFKAFTVAGALEDGLVTPQTSFNLAPTIQVADRVIGESHERGAVTLTTAEILAQSSNIGAITIGLKLGKERFDHWVRRFGFGSTTDVDLPGEATGIVPRAEDYSGSTMGNAPIGQGLAVTPVQMATAYSAIANGGILRPPRVLKSINGRETDEPRGRRVIQRETAASLRLMLEGVLGPGGTASEAAIPGYELAGKTGTANKVDPATGTYSESKYVASFVGFAPARHPRLLVAVMADEPQGAIYGGVVAAPAFQRIVAFALPYLRIPPK